MDAKLKRRMWKVVIVHFCLTLLVIGSFYNSGWSGPNSEAKINWMALQNVKIGALTLLQPQLGILFLADKYFQPQIARYFSWVSPLLLMVAWFISIPLWSICFGWLFVKLDNWLNHFPVLGKRVF